MTTISVGLLGCGTVGSGVLTLLSRGASQIAESAKIQFNVKKIAVKHPEKKRKLTLNDSVQFTSKLEDVTTDPSIQIVIEVMVTIDKAYQAISQALTHGKSVITANKDLIALKGPALTKLARKNHVDLYYEASVGGGIPILRILSDSLFTDQITGLTGIVNGTSNYILSSMKNDHHSYHDSLNDAQKLGYAESDPTNDVAGWDASYKLAILSQLAFGHPINLNSLTRTGIENVTTNDINGAHFWNLTIKPAVVARKQANQLFTLVGPVAIPKESPLSRVDGVENSILVESTALGTTAYTGPGAGSEPTANSIMSDLLAVSRNLRFRQSGQSFNVPSNDVVESPLTNLPLRYFIAINDATRTEIKPSMSNSEYIEDLIETSSACFCVTSKLTHLQQNSLAKSLAERFTNIHFYPIIK